MNHLVGTKFVGKIKDLTSDGRGVVTHPSGKTLFVSGVWPQEEGEFKVTGLKGRIGFAEVVDLTVKSHDRKESIPCRFHGQSRNSCGGCSWMYMAYDAQLSAKQARVESTFARLNQKVNINPIIPSEELFHYRNRAQLKTDGQKLGFVAPHSNNIVDVDHCVVLSEINNQTLSEIRKTLPNSAWRPHRKHPWTTLDIDEGVNLESLSVNRRLNFQQANNAQNLSMQQWLLSQLETIDKHSKIIELFCGSGNFTLPIATLGFERIVAVEGDQNAIDLLERKKIQQNVTGITLTTMNLFDRRSCEMLFNSHRDAQLLVLDPPREGFKHMDCVLDKKSKLKEPLINLG